MENTQEKISINAAGKRLGILASEVANLLNGKHMPEYAPNKAPNLVVEVSNAAQMQITEKKKIEKIYERYTGYFGGRKEMTLAQLIEQKGYGEALRKAVYGMLPGNRLRKVKMKKLQINE